MVGQQLKQYILIIIVSNSNNSTNPDNSSSSNNSTNPDNGVVSVLCCNHFTIKVVG